MRCFHSNLGTFHNRVVAPTAYQLRNSEVVKPSHWQGVSIEGKPDMETHEILNHSSEIDLTALEALEVYQDAFKPDLPWADDHFAERVCGFPINPGVEWAKWRMGKGAEKFLQDDGMFNHNYMERIWPKFAHRNVWIGPTETAEEWAEKIKNFFELKAHPGIRGSYGDLNSVIGLLQENPLARQAFLPMFFPEDTGSSSRTPCSLGWHFICRQDRLHMIYYLRSCDFVNHWRNDLYMAARLLLWVLEQLRGQDDSGYWKTVQPGTLTTHITSLHCFRGQAHLLSGSEYEARK